MIGSLTRTACVTGALANNVPKLTCETEAPTFQEPRIARGNLDDLPGKKMSVIRTGRGRSASKLHLAIASLMAGTSFVGTAHAQTASDLHCDANTPVFRDGGSSTLYLNSQGRGIAKNGGVFSSYARPESGIDYAVHGGDGSDGSDGVTGDGDDGDAGGTPPTIVAINCGTITTAGARVHGILVESQGGRGGNGGDGGVFGSSGSSGNGGKGGDLIVVTNDLSQIHTQNDDAYGIHALTRGGVGGDGGDGGWFTSGARGAIGGDAGSISITSIDHGTSPIIDTIGAGADAIHARSEGGHAGYGGNGAQIVGGSAGSGGSAGNGGSDVRVENSTLIQTRGRGASGMRLESIGGQGGDGGNQLSMFVAIGASGGIGGRGGRIDVVNSGSITTRGDDAKGITAQSLGGGGGNGGDAFNIGAFGGVSIGGSGGGGGNADSISITNSSNISTSGTGSNAVHANSVGGGGGDGGYATGVTAGVIGAVQVSIGGKGGNGGHGGNVDFHQIGSDATRSIITGRIYEISRPIFAPPPRPIIAGTGHFVGDQANAIVTQSIGGGGGSGGRAIAIAASGSDTPSISVAVGVGGSGGNGGDGGTVASTIDGDTKVTTTGRNAQGVVAQSIGGGGGHGGSVITVAAAVGSAAGSVSLGIGGTGGSGGTGGKATVASNADVTTMSSMSNGIVARSVGGGGGSGGNVIDIAAGLSKYSGSVAVGIGGHGGGGGKASASDITSGGIVKTSGNLSHGLLSQSIGGGGGGGGNVHTYAISASVGGGSSGLAAATSVAVGGSGGTGNTSSLASITQKGAVITDGDASNGAFVQSIGGGGGDGGNVFGLSVAASLDKGGSEGTQGGRDLSATVVVGGSGGTGGKAGEAWYYGTPNASVTTQGVRSAGVVVQSTGGGGGTGGIAQSFSASSAIPVDQARLIADRNGLLDKIGKGPTDKGPAADTKNGLTASVAVGGKGGSGNDGGLVLANLDSAMTIHTVGSQSYGLMAQSVGGGGGMGGHGFSDGFAGVDSYALNIAVGGSGGAGGNGGDVYVKSYNRTYGIVGILTESDHSHGMIAQSIGGGGGEAGYAKSHLYSPPRLSNQTVAVDVGGKGGASGKGGAVDVRYDQSITTRGDHASAIVVQSVGGGGGIGGAASATGKIEVTVGGSGGASGDGGLVIVMGDSALTTSGAGSHGLIAQSVGGGGGMGGNAGGDGSMKDYGLKVHVGGSGQGGGKGGKVLVNRDGLISTSGVAAFGILAQSVGGGGGITAETNLTAIVTNNAIETSSSASSGDGGDVAIGAARGSLAISTSGTSAHGVFAQSLGGGGGIVIVPDDLRYVQATNDGQSPSSGGHVWVSGIDDISTSGDHAYGIFAESLSSGMTLISTAGGTRSLGFGIDGKGDVVVEQIGSLMTQGVGAHGIVANNSNQSSASAIGITVGGAVIATGEDAWGIVATNGANSLGIYTAKTASVNVAEGGLVRVGDRSAGAIDLNNRLGTTTLTVGGAVIAEGGIAVQSFGPVDMTVGRNGRVVGDMVAGTGAFDIVNSGTIAGSIGSAASPAGTYTMADGGRHMLAIDPRGVAGGTDGIHAGAIVTQGGKITPYLTSLPVAAHRVDGIITGAYDGSLIDLIDSRSISTFYDFDKAAGSITLSSVSVDFTRADLQGNDAALATMATGLLGPWTQSIVEGGHQQLNTFLLAAANATTKESLSGLLETFDASNHFSSVDASMLSSSNHLSNMQSCGTTSGTYAAIAESECTWAKVVFGDIERRDGDQKHTTTTWALGQQREIATDLFVGLNAAYESNRYRGVSSSGKGDRIHLGAIAKLSRGPILASAAAALSYGWSDGMRGVSLNGTTARSDHETRGLATRLRAAYLVQPGPIDIVPIVELDMALIDDAGYHEEGAGVFDLKVAGKTHFLADLRPAVRFGSETGIGSSMLRGYVETGARFALNDTSIRVSLPNAPLVHVPGSLAHSRDKVVGTLATGASLNTGGRVEISVRYEAGFGAETRSHVGSLKAGLKF